MIRSIIVLSILFCAFPLFSAEKMRIAIMDFEAKNVSKTDAAMVAELIRNECINVGHFTVIERAQMGRILDEQGYQNTGCTDISCAVEIGKLISARKILVGTLMQLGDTMIITGRIVDVEKGTADFSEKVTAADRNDLVRAVTVFTEKLTARIRGGGTPADDGPSPYGSRPYGWPSIGLWALSGLSLGGGLYFNGRVSAVTDDYDRLSKDYATSEIEAETLKLHDELKSKADESDSYTMYRNISYGVFGASVIAAVYFTYRYFSFTPVKTASAGTGRAVYLMPLWSLAPDRDAGGRASGCSFTAGITASF